MRFLPLVFLLSLLVSCATATKQTNALVKDREDLPSSSKITNVPFINQEKNHCGPATMAMVLKHAHLDIPLEELNAQMMTSQMEGTFQSEMLGAARRNGMLAIPIENMKSLLQEVSHEHPVIVFQNLGLSSLPQWHYAVVIGHDLKGPDIFLHTGPHESLKQDMRFFERNWILGGNWGLLVLRPDQLSVTASELTHMKAASMLESIGKINEAMIAYETIHKRWPTSLAPLMGLGNVNYQQKKFKKSESYLQKAVSLHPQSAMAWHNLATVQAELGFKKKAQMNSLKALSLADEKTKTEYKKSLQSILPP